MAKYICHSALITGASSGIGAAFARHLARPGCHLVLTARRAERLQALAAELEQAGAQVEILAADLAIEEGIQAVAAKIAALPELDLLINNAGFGVVGPFGRLPIENQAAMLRVHNEAPMRLTHAALQNMLARSQGAIINVSSVSAFLRTENGVMYCATKAFLTAFSEALHEELHGTGVKVQSLCPGFTRTEFHEPRDFMDMDTQRIPAFLWMDARVVTAASLKALNRDQGVVVPGMLYKLLVFFARFGLVQAAVQLSRKLVLFKKA
jgi:uncharacterized protein